MNFMLLAELKALREDVLRIASPKWIVRVRQHYSLNRACRILVSFL